MLLRTFFCIGFLASATISKAQLDDLLHSPDVTWVAEYTTDYLMNLDGSEEYPYEMALNYFDLLQFINSGNDHGLYGREILPSNYLSQQVLTAAQKPKISLFKDSSCQNTLTPAELYSSLTKVDTVIGCCDCLSSDMYHIVKTEVSIEGVWCFRIRQLFWYNQNRKTFEASLLAYAPVVFTRDNEGNITGTRTLFWVKANEMPPKTFKSKSFNYIYQTKMLNNAPNQNDFKIIKGVLDFKKLFAKELSFPSRPLINGNTFEPITPNTLSEDCFATDTIRSYNPTTYEEVIQLESRNCIEQIERIRFVQNWYYDERNQQLYTRLVGAAPLAAIRDSEGGIRYYKPLFYQMYR